MRIKKAKKSGYQRFRVRSASMDVKWVLLLVMRLPFVTGVCW
jgi:hypothetical protein